MVGTEAMNPLCCAAGREAWRFVSLPRMTVIIVARPTTIPDRRGARKVMFDLISDTTFSSLVPQSGQLGSINQ